MNKRRRDFLEFGYVFSFRRFTSVRLISIRKYFQFECCSSSWLSHYFVLTFFSCFLFSVVFVVVKDWRWRIYLLQVSAQHCVPLSVYWNQIESENPKVKKIQLNDEQKNSNAHFLYLIIQFNWFCRKSHTTAASSFGVSVQRYLHRNFSHVIVLI